MGGWSRVRRKAVKTALPVILRPSPRSDLVRIGTEYGGWWIPATLLGPSSTCYLAGAGEDISFDLGLMERFGCEVVSLDPTPRAVEHVRTHAPAVGYHFLEVGLGGSDGTARFYAPSDPAHVSHSIANLQGTTEYFEAEIRSLETLLRELDDQHIDLLKIDIEGAEYAVMDSMFRCGIFPGVLCVEFDQPAPVLRTRRYVRRLVRCGYSVVKVDGFNVTLVRSTHEDVG